MSEKYTVEEIKRILQQDVVDEVFIDELKQDGRTSVQKLLKQYENKIQKEYDEFQKLLRCQFMKMNCVTVESN